MEEKIKKLYDGLDRGVMFLCKLFLIADILITSYAVLGRYCQQIAMKVPALGFLGAIKDPSWSEEIVLTCMIYMAFLSAALAIRKQSHIRMTSLDQYLPVKLVQVLDIFGDVLVLGFSLAMLYYGTAYALQQKGFYVSLPWLSKLWLYLPVALSAAATILFEAEVVYKHIRALMTKEAV